MASIILKKRKLCEAFNSELELRPLGFEMKRQVNEQGEYKQLYESVLPQLKELFPERDINQLLETLKFHNNDIISAIEYLNYHKIQLPSVIPRDLEDHNKDLCNKVDQIKACNSKEQVFYILNRFQTEINTENNNKIEKLAAENQLLRKAFIIQRKILLDEGKNKQEMENKIVEIYRDLMRTKSDNVRLSTRLEQLEKNYGGNIQNDHIY